MLTRHERSYSQVVGTGMSLPKFLGWLQADYLIWKICQLQHEPQIEDRLVDTDDADLLKASISLDYLSPFQNHYDIDFVRNKPCVLADYLRSIRF